MRESFTELTRLEPLDIFYVGERHKTFFEYPAHCHAAYELNFVENAAGATRTIGDSHESIGALDLVLMTGSRLVHVWEQGTCPRQDLHEITIHMDPAPSADRSWRSVHSSASAACWTVRNAAWRSPKRLSASCAKISSTWRNPTIALPLSCASSTCSTVYRS